MGSGEASRCRLMRLPVARQQIPKTPACQPVRGCLTVYLLPRPYPPSGGPASPLPVLRGAGFHTPAHLRFIASTAATIAARSSCWPRWRSRWPRL